MTTYPTSTFIERRRYAMELEKWLETVPALALKELAGYGPEVHAVPRAGVIKFILSDEWARRNALASMRIEAATLASIKARGESPSKAWAERFALPW